MYLQYQHNKIEAVDSCNTNGIRSLNAVLSPFFFSFDPVLHANNSIAHLDRPFSKFFLVLLLEFNDLNFIKF